MRFHLPDGTFIIDGYHVCPRTPVQGRPEIPVDPYNAYDWHALDAEFQRNPENFNDFEAQKVVEEKRKNLARYEEYLRQTDWYETRKSQTGKPVPEDVLDDRQIAREQIEALRVDLGIATDVLRLPEHLRPEDTV